MIRITTYVLVALTVVIITASYGSEVSQELVRRFQQNPEKLCQLTEPVADILNGLTVPIGAQHRKETIWRATAPDDFHAVLALMQVTSVTPCALVPEKESILAIRAMRLIEYNPNTGEETIVSTVTDFSGESDNFRFDGEFYSKIPVWYSGHPSKPTTELKREKDVLTIDLTQTPRLLFHGWTDPKVSTTPGMHYFVEMEVRISGSARLQMGVDYWREIGSAYNVFDQTCQKSNNCEGYLSQWFGPTDDWQTLRAPKILAQ